MYQTEARAMQAHSLPVWRKGGRALSLQREDGSAKEKKTLGLKGLLLFRKKQAGVSRTWRKQGIRQTPWLRMKCPTRMLKRWTWSQLSNISISNHRQLTSRIWIIDSKRTIWTAHKHFKVKFCSEGGRYRVQNLFQLQNEITTLHVLICEHTTVFNLCNTPTRLNNVPKDIRA